ncbi:MAG: hypothetical protein HQ549_04900 [Candidatus Omnitrophica bacterium]|nr:hypothetical protein [Candidatus Omnitrophota bacterium]
MSKRARRFLLISLILLLSMNLAGCASLKKKFTRKKKIEPKASFYHVRAYDVKPSLELYEKHYIFWVNWHKELIQELGQNRKSDIRCTEEMTSNLWDMMALLEDDKAAALAPHLDETKKIKEIIKKGNMTTANETRIRRILETEYRDIKRNFSPTKMAGHIRREFKSEEITED